MDEIRKLTLDLDQTTAIITGANGETRSLPLYSPEAFAAISRFWIRTGWALKFSYNFQWMGRPIIQLPEDILGIQEAIYAVRPDVIVETGVAHGGSAVFYASLFETLGNGRVISIDIEIRKHNRKAIEEHPLKKRITLIEGSSTDSTVLDQVRGLIHEGEKVMVVLDSNHTKSHVLQELKAYAPLVSAGSYIVATDGIMYDLHDVPGGRPEWAADNPRAAVHEFLECRPEFEIDSEPARLGVTYWPDAYLRRK